MELDSSVSLSAIPIQWRTGTFEQPLDLWGISRGAENTSGFHIKGEKKISVAEIVLRGEKREE